MKSFLILLMLIGIVSAAVNITISGTVTYSGGEQDINQTTILFNDPYIGRVTIPYAGYGVLPYSAPIPTTWGGYIVPIRLGYKFTPDSIRVPAPVAFNLPNQNFIGTDTMHPQIKIKRNRTNLYINQIDTIFCNIYDNSSTIDTLIEAISYDSGKTWVNMLSTLGTNSIAAYDTIYYGQRLSFIPTIPTNNALVRVITWDHALLADTAISAPFRVLDTLKPVITLTSPGHGQIWHGGSTHSVTWTATDNSVVASRSIYFNSILLDSANTNTGTWTWAVPSNLVATGLFKIIAYDAAGNFNYDTATISITDTIPPTVSVTGPTAGLSYNVGSAIPITWTGTDNIGVISRAISLSRDSGTTWVVLDSSATNTGTYAFTANLPASTKCQIRIIAYDAAGNKGTALSGVFAIRADAPVISSVSVPVLQPAGSVPVYVNQAVKNTWVCTPTLKIISYATYLSLDSGLTYARVDSGAGNPGTTIWGTPQKISTKCFVQMRLYDTLGHVGTGTSPIFIIWDNTPPMVGFAGMTPTKDSVWIVGSNKYIGLVGKDQIGIASRKVSFSSDSGLTWATQDSGKFVPNIPNYELWTWTVPSVNSKKCLLRLTVWDSAGNTAFATTQAFSIQATVGILHTVFRVPTVMGFQVTGNGIQVSATERCQFILLDLRGQQIVKRDIPTIGYFTVPMNSVHGHYLGMLKSADRTLIRKVSIF